MVSNSWMRLADSSLIKRVVVDEGPDAADDWIAAQISACDIVVTADIPLAARCLAAGAKVVGPSGKPFTESSIGMALAMRDLMADLRETGQAQGGNSAFTRQDRSRFLQRLDEMIQRVRRRS